MLNVGRGQRERSFHSRTPANMSCVVSSFAHKPPRSFPFFRSIEKRNMQGLSAHHLQQHSHQYHYPWIVRAVMQSTSAPEADAVTPFDRWREWALSLRKTSRDNLLMCRADKRAMRHMTILEDDTLSSTFGDVNEAEVGESSGVREQHLEGRSPPALSQRPRAPSPPHAPVRPRHDQPAPRPTTNALTAYPNVDDFASVAETAVEVVVKAILRPVRSQDAPQQRGPEALRADIVDLRRRDNAAGPVHDDAVARSDDDGAGSLDAVKRRTVSREPTRDDAVLDSRDLPARAVPGGAFPPHPDDAGTKESRLPPFSMLEVEGKGARRVAPPASSALLQQMVGKEVTVVPRSEVVDAYHKGRAVAVICPCCATSLLAPMSASSSRAMIYCPVCESVAPCTLCVET
jgi:hypothetical protein